MPGIRPSIFALLIPALLLCAPVSAFAGEALRHVQDQTGRTIAVPTVPGRVIALAPSITEIVFAIGQAGRLAGVTLYSDYPPEAHRIPKVGSYVQLDLEKIAALAPDLCIAVKDGNPIEVIRRLESLNIPIYAVNPVNLTSVMAAIREIGMLLNATDAAEALIQEMSHRISAVQSAAERMPHRPGVFFQIGINPIVGVGTATFIHELITTAGGRNLTEGPIPYPRLSREGVLALAPDVMIMTSMARGGAFREMKARWEQWPDLPAVREKRIHVVDSDLYDRPGPRMVDGLEELFRLIHPRPAGGE